tara:strand:+ start:421 stop:657 length:237 start_codon:yes stop_codon:yes gene_type:complete
MSVLNKLEQKGSQFSGLDGATPPIPNFQQSTLHKDYSTDGNPNAMSVTPNNGVLPSPSLLDRGSSLSTKKNYLQRLPQ